MKCHVHLSCSLAASYCIVGSQYGQGIRLGTSLLSVQANSCGNVSLETIQTVNLESEVHFSCSKAGIPAVEPCVIKAVGFSDTSISTCKMKRASYFVLQT